MKKDAIHVQSESAIQRAILDALRWRGLFFWRNNVSPIPIRKGREIVGVRRVDPHIVGMPDIMGIVKGRAVGIEVKKPRGKQSPAQKEWETKMRKAGGIYLVASSVEAVEKALKELDLL